VVFIGTLNKELSICVLDSIGNPISGQGGCYDFIPVFQWIKRSIVSLLLVFFIAFMPLFLTGLFRPFVSSWLY
jgi:1,3-beta-glucan synthase